MAWLALALAFLVQAAAPSAPAPAAGPRAAPVRPRPQTGPSTVQFAPGSARAGGEGLAVVHRLAAVGRGNGRGDAGTLAIADHEAAGAASRRLSQRRARAVAADALVDNGIRRAVIVQRPVGQSVHRVMPPDGVPDPFNRYALIIFPVPPPR